MQALTLSTTALKADATPFVPGFDVVGQVLSGTTAANILGSDDGTTYTTLVAGVASALAVGSFTMPAFIKTSAGSAFLIGGA